jgi:hypothetical protein
MKKLNLKEVVVQKELSEKKYNNNDNTSNYNIYIAKKDFNSIIFSLNTLITDINNNQQKTYLISQIETIIFKLKNFDIPPEIQLQTIPTFKTEKILEDNNDYNPNQEKEENYNKIEANKIEFDLKELGIDTKTYCSNSGSENSNKSNNKENKYEGQIINGKKEGKGKYVYKNGCIYEGYFKNDKKEGNGIFYYTNGDRYKGLFKDGFYQGNGIFYFNNGDRYEGEFDKNSYSGNGKYFYHNGDKFEGLWKNDKKNGKGVYIYLNGNKIIGNYKDGKPIGTHIKYSNEGKMTQIKYTNG